MRKYDICGLNFTSAKDAYAKDNENQPCLIFAAKEIF